MRSTFQTIVIAIFVVGFIGAIAVFSGLLGSSSKSNNEEIQGTVYIWGIIPRDTMQAYVDTFNAQDLGYTISYEEHAEENFRNDLINALADNTSPDVVIFSSEIFSQFKDKLYTIPYVAYEERAYRDTHIDGAQIFLNSEGILGLPLVVDPLVVYYNKDIVNGANFVVPPATWSNLVRSVPIFTKRNAQNQIEQSTIALGDAENVVHMKDILSTLFLQTGNPVIQFDSVLNRDEAVLSSSGNVSATAEIPTAQALSFYTSFSDPTNTNYSWNRSLPNSLQMFLSGRSTFYIGRASELFTIQAQNPNLNFDVKEMFQADGAVRPITYGSYIAAGVMERAPNFAAAYAFASTLATKDGVDQISKAMSLPPARRDLLLVQQNNPYVSVFFRAALSAFAWPDPNPSRTEEIFRAMISDVTSGRLDSESAIYEATRDLQSAIQ